MTHRRSKTVEYKTWSSIKGRCNRSTYIGFKNYGARGIKVCPSWSSSFEQFFRDMGPKPSPEHSIERIDNNKNYEPSNCRWATSVEQAHNRRDNVHLTFAGKTQGIIQWAKELGISECRLRGRIRIGWKPERALTAPKVLGRPGAR